MKKAKKLAITKFYLKDKESVGIEIKLEDDYCCESCGIESENGGKVYSIDGGIGLCPGCVKGLYNLLF